MDNIRVLVSYQEQNEVVCLEKSKLQELISISRQRFQIPVTKSIKFQRYDSEWGTDVIVGVQEVKDKDQLKMVVFDAALVSFDSSSVSESESERSSFVSFMANDDNFPEVISVTEPGIFIPEEPCKPSPTHCEETRPHNPSSSAEDQPSASSCKSQLSLSPSPVEVSNQPWPEVFTVPKFPHVLLTKLNAGHFPDERQRRQIIQMLFDKVCEFTKCPTREQYTQVARTLVQTYPCLAQELPVGNSFDYWKTKLADKFRNERRHLPIPVPRKKVKRSPGGHAVAVSTDLPIGEDEKSMEMHEKWMVQEVKKRSPDTAKLTQLMETTFPLRRKKILEEKMLIQDVKIRYPALFTSAEISKEFKRITGIHIHDMVTNLAKLADGILRQKYHEDLTQLIARAHALNSNSEAEHSERKLATAFFLLPSLFKPKQRQKIIKVDGDISEDNVEVFPVIISSGDILEQRSLYKVVSEQQELLTVNHLPEAFCVVFSSFYIFDMEYPKEARDFYVFLESVLLKMPESKPTQKVRSVLAKLTH